MNLTGLHLMLTYECNLRCDHCFAWGSPWQSGTMTLADVTHILDQAQQTGTVHSIYFEGGEAFLYYATLVRGVQLAAGAGFNVGLVSNGYWATSVADAKQWLRPLAGLIDDLSLSSDLYHWRSKLAERVENAQKAAAELGIPLGTISIAGPEAADATGARGQLPPGESRLMYRGRAAEKLAPFAPHEPWEHFTHCPYEDFQEPARVHVDALGHVHLCQGISLGNIFETSLVEICEEYDTEQHPIAAPLLSEGPAGLVRRFDLAHEPAYADACHLCYAARYALRERFPDVLAPEQMYGEIG